MGFLAEVALPASSSRRRLGRPLPYFGTGLNT
jgi:hypothetical protein